MNLIYIFFFYSFAEISLHFLSQRNTKQMYGPFHTKGPYRSACHLIRLSIHLYGPVGVNRLVQLPISNLINSTRKKKKKKSERDLSPSL